MKNNIVTFRDQAYTASANHIKNIQFSDKGRYTQIGVLYSTTDQIEIAFTIPNEDNSLDITILAYLYSEIMTANYNSIRGI